MNSLPLYRRVSRIGDSIAVNVYSDNENVFERLGLLYDDRFSPDEPCLSMALYIVTCLDGGIELPVVETPVFHGDMLLVIDEGGMRYSDYAGRALSVFSKLSRRAVLDCPRLFDYHPDFVAINVMRPLMEDLLASAGCLTIHAASVAVNGQAIMIAGPTGCGKSTLLDKLLESGAAFLADDRSVLTESGGSVTVELFPEHIRRSISRDRPKTRTVPELSVRTAPLRAVFFLDPGDGVEVALRRIGPSESAARLMGHLPPQYGQPELDHAADIATCLHGSTEAYVLEGWGDPGAWCSMILERMRY